MYVKFLLSPWEGYVSDRPTKNYFLPPMGRLSSHVLKLVSSPWNG